MKSLRPLLVLGLILISRPAQSGTPDATPDSALDPKAAVTGVFAFRNYDGGPPRVTLILCTDRLLEPSAGPSWFPFDPDLLYEIQIDNDNDAVADLRFQFRFKTEQRQPDSYQAYTGTGSGINSPANSPDPVPPGALVIPPQITSFDAAGLAQRQTYTVTMLRGRKNTPITGSGPLYAVPPNVGPRTMDYSALFTAATYSTNLAEVQVFAGTVDDPVWSDLGGFYDTLNFRGSANGGFLSPSQDASLQNVASDMHSGSAVNAIAIQVPVTMLTRTGTLKDAASTAATIGVWGTTSRPSKTVRRSPAPPKSLGTWRQTGRMGNPLVADFILGNARKDRFLFDQPKKDSQFSAQFFDPPIARFFNAITGGSVAIPPPPRDDLRPLFTYVPPIAAPGTVAGPIADLLRLNTGIAPVAPGSSSRLGILGGDLAGFPNGRRLFDDVTDIMLRAVAGGVWSSGFNVNPNNRIGDGVNSNDVSFRTTFPFLGNCPSGRDRRHLDPGEAGGGGN